MTAQARGSAFHLALAGEIALAPLAAALGLALGVSPWSSCSLNSRAIALGVAAALPMMPLLLLSARHPAAPFRSIREILDDLLDHILPCDSWWPVVLLSAAAGIGEEALFRGVLQPSIARGTNDLASWMLVSLLFGLLHAITPTYAVLATLMGLYLGGLWLATGNLLVPILAHAVYDLVAFGYFLRARRRPTIGGDDLAPPEDPQP